jgi:ABC-type antimicrobial peptide transport system permease subunit
MKQPIAVVPAGLLAALNRLKQGSLAFDPVNQEFQRINLPNQYFSGRFYARVLEDVPVIDDRLTQLGYSTVSNKLRVVEMQGYASTLDLLVGILQAIAVALGVVTASVIFLEVTRRRQASIAIMRIVGMDSVGIFLFVFVRAILIAGLGWAIASLIAAIISIALPFLTNAECRLLVSDYIRVLAGAIACSVLGISFHAYAATKIPPLEGIKQGKVQ